MRFQTVILRLAFLTHLRDAEAGCRRSRFSRSARTRAATNNSGVIDLVQVVKFTNYHGMSCYEA